MTSEAIARKPIMVIEHCEETLSPWLILEYRHSSLIYGREYLWFTNIPARYSRILSKYGVVKEKSIVELTWQGELDPRDVIILDPQAPDPLTYEKLLSKKYVVVGGILGDHPPRGRTKQQITSRMPTGVEAYNIGSGQYSIDGAVYVVKYLLDHGDLSELDYTDGLTIDLGDRVITLPFRYPLVNGKPLVSRELIHYLTHGTLPEEVWIEIKRENRYQ